MKSAGAPESCPPVPSSLRRVGFHLDFRLSAHSKDRCLWIIEKPILRGQGELCNPSIFSYPCKESYSRTQEAEEYVFSRESEISEASTIGRRCFDPGSLVCRALQAVQMALGRKSSHLPLPPLPPLAYRSGKTFIGINCSFIALDIKVLKYQGSLEKCLPKSPHSFKRR